MMPSLSASSSSSASTGPFKGGAFRGGGGNSRNYNFGGGGSVSWGVILGILGAVAAVGAIVWAILRKKGKS